jgi:ATP-dependent 26S proteasome regulatory subunit
MDNLEIRQERAHNLWTSVQRKTPPLASATILHPNPQVEPEQIGGLAQAQEEVVTYACALTNPELYKSWGTFPPSGLLLIGHPGTGKTLLAAAMATRAKTPFLKVEVPRLALEIVHYAAKAAEMLDAWSQALQEMPPLSVFFHELEFSQAQAFGFNRPDLPIGPIMDFLLEFIERAIAVPDTLVVGSTTSPVTLRHAFLAPGRFERVVEVTPRFPEDIVAALEIHSRAAEKRAGRSLFDPIDWPEVVRNLQEPSIGDWIRLMHGVLRRKARRESTGEDAGLVTTDELTAEVERFKKAQGRISGPDGSGTYV